MFHGNIKCWSPGIFVNRRIGVNTYRSQGSGKNWTTNWAIASENTKIVLLDRNLGCEPGDNQFATKIDARRRTGRRIEAGQGFRSEQPSEPGEG